MAEIETTATTKRTLKEAVIAKRDKIIFFVLNLALVIPFLVENYTHIGLGAAFLIMLWAFYRCVVKASDQLPAARRIPQLLFFDVLAHLAISYEDLAMYFIGENFSSVMYSIEGKGATILLAGLVLNILVSKKWSNLQWLKYAAKTLIGVSFILMIWGNGGLLHPNFNLGGDIMFVFYLMFSLVWFLFCSIAYRLEPEVYVAKPLARLSNLLLIFFVLFCSTEFELAMEFLMDARIFLLDMPDDGLNWWKVILGAVILVGCAIATYDRKRDTMGVDSLVLCFIASAMILLRVLMANYFAYNWIIFAVFLFSSLRCLRNEIAGEKTLQLNALIYTVVQLAVLLAATWLIKAGLWINVVVIALYTMIFYSAYNKNTAEWHPLRFWLIVFSAPAVYAIAYIWQTRFHMETIILILVAYAVFAFVLIVLSQPHPDNLPVPKVYRVVLCGFLALLCWFAMGRNGAKVDIQPDLLWEETYVTIESNGKENYVVSAQYQWSTKTGKTLTAGEMNPSGDILPIEGEVLTVTTTDAYGVRTIKTQWYPDWLITFSTELTEE